MAQRLSTATIFLSEFIAGGWAEGVYEGKRVLSMGSTFAESGRKEKDIFFVSRIFLSQNSKTLFDGGAPLRPKLGCIPNVQTILSHTKNQEYP